MLHYIHNKRAFTTGDYMNITSEEIAKLANVSRSTVSRVINHYPNVPEETRIRVMQRREDGEVSCLPIFLG